mmetsp:Transcript_26974/g.79688  ORF Transcript_26974/g.79688 Transcript_26974/m.79688 type:complete len:449 (-) Transcript_26974:271-1617(-)
MLRHDPLPHTLGVHLRQIDPDLTDELLGMLRHQPRSEQFGQSRSNHHVQHFEELRSFVEAIEIHGQIRERIALLDPRVREGRQDRLDVVVVLVEEAHEFRRVAEGRVHAHADAGGGGVGGVSHDDDLIRGRMIEAAMDLTGAIPSLVDPLTREVVVIVQLEGLEVILQVFRHDRGVVALHLGGEAIEVLSGHPERNVEHVPLFGQGDALHERQGGGEEMDGGGIDRCRTPDVYGLEGAEDVPDVAFEIAMTLEDGLADAGAYSVAPDEELVVDVSLVRAVRVPDEHAASVAVDVEYLGIVHGRKGRIVAVPVLVVQISGHGRADVIPIDDVPLVRRTFLCPDALLELPGADVKRSGGEAHAHLGHVLVVQFRYGAERVESVSRQADHPRAVLLQLGLRVELAVILAGVDQGHTVPDVGLGAIPMQEEGGEEESGGTGAGNDDVSDRER